jgi:hypothetical protein
MDKNKLKKILTLNNIITLIVLPILIIMLKIKEDSPQIVLIIISLISFIIFFLVVDYIIINKIHKIRNLNLKQRKIFYSLATSYFIIYFLKQQHVKVSTLFIIFFPIAFILYKIMNKIKLPK